MVFSKDGIEPDPKKIDALIIMTPPTSVGEVQSLLGMTNVLARFFFTPVATTMTAISWRP